MNILTMNTSGINVLGRLGENDYTQARFDVDAWLSEYPAGQITLLNQRCGDTDAYPVAGVSVSGSTVLWVVSDTDLSRGGVGRCELIMLVGGVVAKSAIYMTKVLPALDGSGEAPEPWESWQTAFAALKDEAVAAADDAEAASEAVQDMGVDAETLEPGSDATVTKTIDPETGAVTLTFGVPAGESGPTPDLTIGTVSTLPAGSDATATITGTPEEPVLNLGLPQGAQGDPGDKGDPGSDGVSPAVQVTEITGGHRVTVTDATGTHTFDVMDGAQGDPGETGNGIASIVKTATSGLVDTYTITYTDGSTTTYTVTNGAEGDPGEGVPTGGTTGQMLVKASNADYATEWIDPPEGEVTQEEFDALKQYVLDMSPVTTVTAPVVSVTDAAPLDAEDVLVNIEPVQAGSGDPSPDNVRPISGWTGAKVTRTGKNLIDDAYADTSGSNFLWIYRNVGLLLKANQTYTFSVNKTVDSIRIVSVDESVIYASISSARSSLSYSPTADVLVVFRVWKNGGGTLSGLNPQLELGSTVTDYEPYQGDTYDITFPSAAGTVYGGTLDVTNGVLTVERAQISSYAGETLPGAWISDRDVYAAGATPTTGAQVVYELATPITYTLTPQQIALLRGNNALWADTGDTTLTYRQDVGLLLEAITAPDETDMTADTNYAVNSFFNVGGTLYKATAAIATGETIQPGVNCTATTVADQLTAIFAQL